MKIGIDKNDAAVVSMARALAAFTQAMSELDLTKAQKLQLKKRMSELLAEQPGQ